MHRFLIALTALSLTAVPAVAAPNQCRDTKGHFIKCKSHPVAQTKCRDAKGHFTSCNAKGARKG